MKFIKNFLFQEDGGKKILKKKSVAIFTIILFTMGLVALLLPRVIDTLRGNDTSKIKKTSTLIINDEANKKVGDQSNKQEDENVGGVSNNPPSQGGQSKESQHQNIRASKKITYRAGQVIKRDEISNKEGLPIGTNIVGKLLSSVDTRSLSLKKAILPYGVKNKTGDEVLPSGTVLIGQPSYPGQGEKVFISFTKGVLPNGKEIDLQAQALNTKDFSPGLSGEFHSNTTNRMASVLGLSMVGGVSEVLVEKESLGQSFNPTPKATIKNGLFNGASKVANMEANIQAQKLAAKPEYVTIEAGRDLIISFFSFSLSK